MKRLYRFCLLVWRENMAGSRVTIADAWKMTGVRR